MAVTATKKKKQGKENVETDKTRKLTRKAASASKSLAKKVQPSKATKDKGKGRKLTGKKSGTKTVPLEDDEGDLELDEQELQVDNDASDVSENQGGYDQPEISGKPGHSRDSSRSPQSRNGNRTGTSNRGETMDSNSELERSNQANETLRIMLDRRAKEVEDYRSVCQSLGLWFALMSDGSHFSNSLKLNQNLLR
jgi:hypothetical protein